MPSVYYYSGVTRGGRPFTAQLKGRTAYVRYSDNLQEEIRMDLWLWRQEITAIEGA